MAGTTADKLNKLQDTKADFKTTMTDMGLDVTDELPFGDYPSILQNINAMKKVPLKIQNTYGEWQTSVGYLEVLENGEIIPRWFGQRGGLVSVTSFAGAPIMLTNYNDYDILSGSMYNSGKTVTIAVRPDSSPATMETFKIAIIGSEGVSIKY